MAIYTLKLKRQAAKLTGTLLAVTNTRTISERETQT